ncbi:MAG: helicase-related protein, partial [Desulfurococcaceae archaeon]
TSTDLIGRGYLVSPVIFMLNTGISGNYGSYPTEKSEVLRNPERVRLAVEVVKRLPKPVLVLTQEKGPGELVAKALKDEGIKAEFVHGELSTQERERILKDVKEGRIEVIVATTLADEGLDLPNLKSLVLYFPGKSSTRVYQRIGRALRPYEGKPVAIVVDMVDQTRYFGEHAAARKRMYQTEGGWRIIEAQNLEDFEQKLQAVLSEAGMALETRRREREGREKWLMGRRWERAARPVAVVGPVAPEMKPPILYKTWSFGPYQIHAYRSVDTDEAVWVYKRVKPVKVAA